MDEHRQSEARERWERLTRTGPGIEGGDLMRRYWQPVALSEELPRGGPPQPVRILGEELVHFRDDQGRPGLLGIKCSHRCADLSYGRLEDGGLRCVYHGWLYDVNGRCLEQPDEPEGGLARDQIRHLSYPCREVGGAVWAYMGPPGEAPLFPSYAAVTAPSEYKFVVRYHVRCNYLQRAESDFSDLVVLTEELEDGVASEAFCALMAKENIYALGALHA